MLRIALATALLVPSAVKAADPAPKLDAAKVEFFETKIRPVLVAECYECHDAKKQKGDLRLDYRDGILKAELHATQNAAEVVQRLRNQRELEVRTEGNVVIVSRRPS